MSLLTLDQELHSPSVGSQHANVVLEDLAFRYGRSAESYLVTEPGRECFWLPNYAGVIVYLRRGRYLHVGGGLLAAEADRPALLESFIHWAAKSRLRALFYNVAPDEINLFRAAGFQATKWGEEAMIDLPTATWKGKRFEWVRRQSNYALRHGLEFVECQPELMAGDAWDRLSQELIEVSNGILSERPQIGDIGFLNGRFDPTTLGRRRLFLARHKELGRIDGFLVCNPCRGGNEWAVNSTATGPMRFAERFPF